jgi:hypothetical protein
MSLFNLGKRLPKKPLLGLAVLALALLAAGGGMAKRADAATIYTIEVSWDYAHWSAIDDGILDHTAEVYGTLQADSWTMSEHAYRMLGNAGAGTCSAQWSGSGPCNKKVSVGPWYNFAQTPLSSSKSANQPAYKYTLDNNKMYFQVAAGNYLSFIVMLSDYDATSANDPMCQLTGDFKYTDAQLQTLNYTQMLQQQSATSDGTCEVAIHLRRI